ncbi:methyltransferase domain-containing protein [Planococcus shixiaomingii]|uniref:methyltransferase domain-containing protein n=1 Tax=Planococcus shixiaomingii TaxID=3058393 RepID=UPI002633154D|nr:methyltransferase domain-containing protein [Planococcus sp. N022]WKA53175.1 methyltransferase domain-containing protein [Planococcus sp. N022]
MSKVKEKNLQLVNDYFDKLSLEPSLSEEEFKGLLEKDFWQLSNDFQLAREKVTVENQEEVYEIKNSNLDFSLAVAKSLADFYKQYCNWFISINRQSPSRILDIGCDNGVLTCFYAYIYPEAEVIGVDKSEAGIQCAKQLAMKLGLTNIDFQQADFHKLNEIFPFEYFDFVISVRTLHEVMRSIPVPIYWSYEDVLNNRPLHMDTYYMKVIERLITKDGEYFSTERLENPAAVGQWAKLLKDADLQLDWSTTNFINFHENGKPNKMPVIVANKKESKFSIIDGLKYLYTRDQNLMLKEHTSFKSVAAEVVFNDISSKNIEIGYFLTLNHEWYKMRFEIWKTEEYFLIYGSGNMGYRQLEIMPVDDYVKAKNKLEKLIERYKTQSEVERYSNIKERDLIEKNLI